MDSTNPTKYNFPYRTNYEAILFCIWLCAAGILYFLPYLFELPKVIYQLAALTCLLTGVITGYRAVEIHIKVKRLKGYPVELINPTQTQTLKMFGLNKEVIKRVKKNRK